MDFPILNLNILCLASGHILPSPPLLLILDKPLSPKFVLVLNQLIERVDSLLRLHRDVEVVLEEVLADFLCVVPELLRVKGLGHLPEVGCHLAQVFLRIQQVLLKDPVYLRGRFY